MKTLPKGLFLACIIALVVGAVQAQAYDRYGAIAYSKSTGQYGYSYDYSTETMAKAQALSNCGDVSCHVYVWFRNACGALAKADNGDLGWGWSGSRGGAEARAIAKCQSVSGRSCNIVCWTCTGR